MRTEAIGGVTRDVEVRLDATLNAERMRRMLAGGHGVTRLARLAESLCQSGKPKLSLLLSVRSVQSAQLLTEELVCHITDEIFIVHGSSRFCSRALAIRLSLSTMADPKRTNDKI